jgi:UDP-N-acetyl-D-glucosamine dehydrogenase
LERGAIVQYHDPHILVAPSMRSWPDLPAMESQPLTKALLNAQDAVLIATDHSSIDYSLVLRESSLLIDTRGVYKDPQPNVVKA